MNILPGEENQAYEAVHGHYERYRKLRVGDTVLDIGAHVGYFTTIAAEKVGSTGQVWAFEPHPDNYDRLVENCAALPWVHTVNAAAWRCDCRMGLFTMANNSGGHSLLQFDGNTGCLEVECVDVGKWLRHSPRTPDFVKIDAESAELAILESLLKIDDWHPSYAIEVHTEKLYADCRALLQAHGYVVQPDSPICRRTLLFANQPDDIGYL